MKRKVLSLRKAVTYLMTLALGLSYAALPLLPAGLTAYAEEGTEEDGRIPIDAAHFPDVNFRNYVTRFNTDDSDYENYTHYLSKEEREAVTKIDVTSSSSSITSLAGIEYFPNLSILICNGNKLTSLDVSSLSNLICLECDRNQITDLNIGENTKLKQLNCRGNKLTKLDVSNFSELENFACDDNTLTKIDVSRNTKLVSFSCRGTGLSEIDISNQPSLVEVNCANNQLTELDISRNKKMARITCYNNQLTELDVSQHPKLEQLYCEGNKITKLDVTQNPELRNLYFSSNPITTIDLSKNPELEQLYCDNTKLTSLDVSQNTKITRFSCSNNPQLAPVDTSHNPELTYYHLSNNLYTDIDLSHNPALIQVLCDGNRLTELDVSQNRALSALYCYGNQLTKLTFGQDSELRTLQCQNNQLSSLDLSGNEKLTSLVCEDNRLTELDVSHNPKLSSIHCSGNQLTSLDLNENPESTLPWYAVVCKDNQYDIGKDITKFDLSNLPGNFDLSKASNWKGAEYIDGILANFDGSGEVTYRYVCRDKDVVLSFKLVYNVKEPDPEPDPDPVHKHQFIDYVCECGAVEIREETFPDQKFRTYVLTNYDWNEDGLLSEKEKELGKNIEVSSDGMEDLTGIEYFTYATSLNCSGNQLTSLDISKNTALTSVVCDNNRYNIGNVSSFDLKNLPGKFDTAKASNWKGADYADGKLTNFSGDGTITYLYEIGNGEKATFTLTYTPTGPGPVHEHRFYGHVCACGAVEADEAIFPDAAFRNYLLDTYDKDKDLILSKEEIEAATTLQIAQKGIRSLTGIEYLTALENLDCSKNALSSLDLNKNTKLKRVYCSHNRLSRLEVNHLTSLEYLDCTYNALTSLDISGSPDAELLCRENSYGIGDVKSFDLKDLPGNFDTAKASNWTGADYADGKLTNFSGDGTITYLYELGNGNTATFLLIYVGAGHEHKFIQQADERYLKAPATCKEAAVYYESCELCGASGTETFSNGQPKEHTWDAGEVIAAPSRTTTGLKRHTCEVCGTRKTEVLEKTAGVTNIEILVGEKVFQGKLYDNEAAKTFKASLPLTLNMNDISGLEKYCNLTESLPTAASVPAAIWAGDILLSESYGLNLFYQDAQPSEQYTPLGYVSELSGLKEALGNRSVTVTIRLGAASNPDDPDDPDNPDITKRYWGDVDGKDGVTVYDALLILLHLADKQPITDKVNMIFADCDGKQGITVADALYILEVLADKREKKLYDGPAIIK